MTPKQTALALISEAHSEVPTTIPVEDWTETIFTITTVIMNSTLPKFPWYRYQKDRLFNERGGYWGVFTDVAAYVIAHAITHPDAPWEAHLAASKDIVNDFRQYDKNPQAGSLEALVVDTLAAPEAEEIEFGDRATAILNLPKDQRGKEILLDVAYGMSVRQAAFRNGITPKSAQERMAVIKRRAREEIA